YYALLKWNPAARFSVSGGLHLISTVAGANQYTTRMFYGKIAYQKHLFDVSLSGSTYANNGSYNQAGFHAGITIPQLNRFYLHSDLYYLAGAAGNNMVYNQGVGFMPMKRLWLEVFSTEGKQQNFVDMNGVYIYNSGDYSTFKTGGTLFYYLNNHIRLFGNYSYDTKYYNNNQFYPQHSITGGIIWKL
ncbi:MAG TPA: hypothetical protein VK152_10625, partial [Paludibacter sp.]|nr:hypothetical protein [Paludibacter sp.]